MYVGAKEGRLTRLALGEGGRLDNGWAFPAQSLDSLGPMYGTPRVDAGRVFAATYDCSGLDCDAQVFAVDIGDASPLWPETTFKLKTSIVGAIAVSADTVVFGTSEVESELESGDSSEGYLYALDARPEAQSRLLWRFPTSAAIWSTPVIDDGVVYFGDMDGVFRAVSLGAEDGEGAGRELWRFEAGGAIVAEPLIADGKIYFGDFSNKFYALDIETRRGARSGSVLNGPGEWTFKSDGWFWAKPLIHEGTLYVGSLNGKFYALDPGTGTQRWTGPGSVKGQIVGGAAVIDTVSGPALAVPSGDGNISVFDARTGTGQNGFATTGGVKARLLADGDFLYAHTRDDDLIKFRVADRSVVFCIDAESGAPCGS